MQRTSPLPRLLLLLAAAGLCGCGAASDGPVSTARVFGSPAPAPAPAAVGDGLQEARRFARAYVRWEVGRARAQDVATLLELASPAVAKENFASPPRQPLSQSPPRAARVLRVTISRESQPAGTVAATAALRRGRREEALGYLLSQQSGRVRVTALLPPTTR